MDEPSSLPHGDELLQHGRFLRALAQGLVAQPDRAEDLVQDTWVAALEHPARHRDALGSWLARILRSLALSHGKREGERTAREAVAARPEASDRAEIAHGAQSEQGPSDISAELELQRRVYECVVKLREPYRTTLYLRYYRGLGPQAIAARERIPVKTVKTRLSRGLELLREDLDRLYGGVRAHWAALLLPLARATPLEPSELVAPVERAPFAAPGERAPLVLGAPTALLGGIALAVTASAAIFLWRAEAPLPIDAEQDLAHAVATSASAAPLVLDAPEGEARRALPASGETASESALAPASVRGSVLDRLGRPIAGADIAIRSLRNRRGPPASRGELFPRGGEVEDGESQVETRTDAEGRFALELAEAGLVRLEVGVDGFAPHGEKLLVFPEQELDRDAIVLVQGVWLEGRVLDQDGRPAPRVRVWQERVDAGLTFSSGGAHDVLVAESDEGGFFRVARQAVGPWSLALESDLHPIAHASGETVRAGERVEHIEVALCIDAAITGRVIGDFDLPVDPGERLRVIARPSGGDHEAERGPRNALRFRDADVAPDGSFSLRGFEAEARVDLVVERLDAEGHLSMASEPRSAFAGETSVEIELQPGASLELVVVDASTGLPLDDAEVQLDLAEKSRRATDELRTKRGTGGALRVEGRLASLGSGSAGILVRSAGYVTRRVEAPGFALGLHCDLGVVALEPAAPLRIEVRDGATGAAIPAALVHCLEVGRGPAPNRGASLARASASPGALVEAEALGISSGRTDAGGVCAIVGEPGHEVELVVRAAGYVEHAAPFTFPDSTSQAQRVLLERGGGVDLQLSSAAGAKLGGALVAHLEGGPSAPGRAWFSRTGVRVADTSGRLSFENLAPGRHAFRLVDAELSRAAALDDAGWTVVEVSEGTRQSLILAAEPAVWLCGSLRRSGIPLAGAQVLVRAAEDGARSIGAREARSSLTDDVGRFEIDGLASGAQCVEIRHESALLSTLRTVDLHAGANEVSFDLEELRVAGIVRDEEGGAIRGVRVRLLAAVELEDRGFESIGAESRREGSEDAAVHTDASGRFECVALGPLSRIVLEASAEGRASQRFESAELAPGAVPAAIELVLDPEARIDLALERSGSSLPMGCLVVLRKLGEDASRAPTQSLFLRAPGTRSIAGLQPGNWSVECFARTRSSAAAPRPLATREVELRSGETVSLRIALP